MTQITRKYQKLFGNTGPTGLVGQFGSYKAGATVYSLDPDIIQSLAAFTNGCQYAGVTGNSLTIQDFNGLIYLLTRQIKYLHQSGAAEWSSGITYFINSIVTDGVGGIYASLIDDNLNNALTDSASWFMLSGKKVTQISDNYNALNTDYIIDWHGGDTSNGHNQIILPNPTAALAGREYIVLVTYSIGQYYVEIVYNSSTVYNLVYGANIVFVCTGTKWAIRHV